MSDAGMCTLEIFSPLFETVYASTIKALHELEDWDFLNVMNNCVSCTSESISVPFHGDLAATDMIILGNSPEMPNKVGFKRNFFNKAVKDLDIYDFSVSCLCRCPKDKLELREDPKKCLVWLRESLLRMPRLQRIWLLGDSPFKVLLRESGSTTNQKYVVRYTMIGDKQVEVRVAPSPQYQVRRRTA